MNFYFFDLETSGFSCRDDRIMQFAGQRTDTDLNPIGEPDNILVKMTPDILPQPDAVLVHGITPQQTLTDGITEAELAKYLTSQVFTKDTIIVGYNNVRFDNDFIRFLFWRNFYDAYEWSYKEGCSTWDLLDVVRMTRALRPEDIKWPFNPDGSPSNKLEFITSVNGLDHADAHDALSDVQASLALAKLLKGKQPKLFNYLLANRKKDKIAPFVTSSKPFVYTSGRYLSEYSKTALVVTICQTPDKSGALVYDLRVDPEEFVDLTPAELADKWRGKKFHHTHADGVQGAGEQHTQVYEQYSEGAAQPATPQSAASASGAAGSARRQAGAVREVDPYFPVKLLKYNKCPAVAPASVLEVGEGYEKLQLHKELVNNHLAKLGKIDGFGGRLLKAMEVMWPPRQGGLVADPQKVDGQLYDAFVSDEDKTKMSALRVAKSDEILDFKFKDERLKLLAPLYKARNHPKQLNETEQAEWENFRRQKLITSGKADSFFKRLEELAKTPGLDGQKKYLLEELNLYAQSVLPGA